MKFYSK